MADENELEPPPAKKRRFLSVEEAAVREAAAASVPANTKTATEFWVRVFHSFCEEAVEAVDVKTCSPKELDDVLGRFYVGLRNQKGEYYKKASYLAARASLSRYFVTVLLREDCNLFRNTAFKHSNNVLDGVLKIKKTDGQEAAVQHKAAICEEDLTKLYRYFEDVLEAGDPVKLTYFCLFHLSLHFGLRGSEVQTQLKKQDVVFEVAPNGNEYVTLQRDFTSKNCPGGLAGTAFESCGRLQEPMQIAAMKKLLSKLHPEVERIFQRALPGLQPETKEVWFAKMPLGRVVIGDMLSRISKASQLSRRYTNHCVRATSVVVLKKAGFDDRSICHVTGHKNAQSLDSYCGPSEEDKRALASALDGNPVAFSSCRSLVPSKPKAEGEPSSLSVSEEASTSEVIVGQASETVKHGSGMASFAVQSSKTVFKHVTFNFGNADYFEARAARSRQLLKLKKKQLS